MTTGAQLIEVGQERYRLHCLTKALHWREETVEHTGLMWSIALLQANLVAKLTNHNRLGVALRQYVNTENTQETLMTILMPL